MDALAYLERKTPIAAAPLLVLTGDEDFLIRQARTRLVADLLEDADPSFALTTFEGEAAEWSRVKSELDTLPFLSPRRVVIIEQADPFVTTYRSQLEKYIAEPSRAGTLVLEVKSWPGNTRLAKQTPEQATIVAKTPGRPASWCRNWAKDHYKKELDTDAADMLIELVGPHLGQLDQELAKLATFAGDKKSITGELVQRLVSHTREAETFKIFDAIGSGRTAIALTILHRLLDQGDAPMALLGAFSWQLRRLATVSRSHRCGLPLPQAMDRAGVPPFARGGIEQQLRHLGKRRMDRVYEWLVETDLGMKGSSYLSDRTQLERLVIRLSRDEQPAGR